MYRSLTPCTLLVAALVSAQPVILNGDNLPQPGFTVARSEGNTSLGQGPAGANQTWDFSTAFLVANGQPYIVLEPGTSEFASEWPTANYVATYSDAGNDRYFYCNVLADRLEAVADNISNLSSYTIYNADRRTILKFPFAFGESVTDTFVPPDGSTLSTTLTYDGYGTLITPNNTFPQVARIQVLAPNGNPSYQWWTLDPLLPVLTYSFGYVVQWADPGTGINDRVGSAAAQVFPNPFTQQTSILVDATTVNNGARFTLSNAVGQVLYSTTLTSTTTVLERGSLASGLYLYHVHSAERPVATGRVVLQ